MAMRSVREIRLSDKRVLVRVDYNVPMDESFNITDDNRIKATLPLLEYLIDQGAKIVLCSHLGRPNGKIVPRLSLAPVATSLSGLLNRKVAFCHDCIGAEAQKKADALNPGQLLLLENLRFHPQEKANDSGFAEKLGALCDVFINDAFAVSHRKQASVVGVTQSVELCAPGFLLEKELACYQDSVEDPKRPLVAVVGGAKVSGKLEALYNMINRVDTLILGGAMANTFLSSLGIDTKASMVEADLVATAGEIIKEAREKGVTLHLPVDLVAGEAFDRNARTQVVTCDKIPADWMALDIGPATGRLFAGAVNRAKTIVWNGPMGVFEMEPFRSGTQAVADAVAGSGAFSVVGGGDTGLAVKLCGVAEKIGYISTGGGAFLHLMEGKELPGVLALEKGWKET